MLWLMLVLGALSPSDAIKNLSKDRHAMRQLKRFDGLKSCTRNLVMRRTNSEGELCRMALLASAAADGRNVRKSAKGYEKLTLQRARYLMEAIGHAETAAKKLTNAKKLPRWKLVKATRAIGALCPIIERLQQEAAMAPLSAPKVRAWSSGGFGPGQSTRQATCRCINALRAVSTPLKSSNKKFIQAANQAVAMSGCVQTRLEVARQTQYVSPKRSRFSQEGRADRVAEKKRIAAPDRETAALNIIERHRNEINACAAEARKLGGARAVRAKRMRRCICSTAKGWRFAPGPKITVEEKAEAGTLVLQLSLSKIGRVKKCGVVVKK